MLIEFGEADAATFWCGYVADNVLEVTWQNQGEQTVSVGQVCSLSRPDDVRPLRLGLWDHEAGGLLRDSVGAPVEVDIPEDRIERVYLY